jgi:hypothetical protein
VLVLIQFQFPVSLLQNCPNTTPYSLFNSQPALTQTLSHLSPEAHSECHQPEKPQFYGSNYSYYNVSVAENRPTVVFCLKSCPIMMIYCFLGLLSLHNKEEGITTTEGGGIFSCLRVVAPSWIWLSILWQVVLYILVSAHRTLQPHAGIAYSSHKTGRVTAVWTTHVFTEMRFLRIVAYKYSNLL